MFVPANRLIGLSLAAAPLGVLAVWGPSGAALGLALWGSLALVAAMDAVWSAGHPPELRVEGPGQIRRAKGQTGTFSLGIETKGLPYGARLDVGVPFPREIESLREVQQVRVPAGEGTQRAEWSFLPYKRGEYTVDAVYIHRPSALGLWKFRHRIPCPLVFRVYPDLRQDRKVMANLLLNRGVTGARLQRVTGQGREYDQIRGYRPGDTPGDIHWKASAKRNSLVTKTYQIERTQEVYLAIDHSRLSARLHPSGPNGEREPVLERYVSAANILAMAASREGDLFGLMTFARNTDRFVRAGAGPHHLRTIQNSLFTLEPENVYPDIDEWVRHTRVNLRRRSLIVLLTDLSDATTFDTLEDRVRLLSRTHLLVVAMIPLPGVMPLFSGPATPDDPWTRLAGHLMWRDLHAFRTRLHAQSVPLLLPRSEDLALDVVNQYLLIKQHQKL